jgi:hypothetical protein
MENSGSDNSIVSTEGTANVMKSGGKAKISEASSSKNTHHKNKGGY